MNHIDSSALRYAEDSTIWRDKYANDEKKWLQTEVAPRLREWGFNTIGWTQEVVVRGPRMVRHSPRFTYEQYRRKRVGLYLGFLRSAAVSIMTFM